VSVDALLSGLARLGWKNAPAASPAGPEPEADPARRTP
jgi:hypothetical protein